MRNSLLIFFACFIPSLASDTLSIESGCVFWGPRPEVVTSHGGLTIHHPPGFKHSRVLGTTSLWDGEGPVWVVFPSESAMLKHRFRVSGNLQTCVK
jgi:hypothetical protein